MGVLSDADADERHLVGIQARVFSETSEVSVEGFRDLTLVLLGALVGGVRCVEARRKSSPWKNRH